MNTEGPCAPRDQPEKECKRERKKKERIDTGEPGFRGTGPGPSLYFSGKLLYFKLHIEINARSRVTQGQLLRPLSKDRVFFAYLCSYKGLTFVYNIFWSGDRLTFYGPIFLSIDKD